VHGPIFEPTQVCEATEKCLKAIAVNKDTICADTAIWKRVQNKHHNLIYISPELVVGVGSPMLLLWKDPVFGKLLRAIFIDKVHCIDEWGAKFHEEYQSLKQLHSVTGFEVPIIACSATMPTLMFNIIWDSLDYETPAILRPICRHHSRKSLLHYLSHRQCQRTAPSHSQHPAHFPHSQHSFEFHSKNAGLFCYP
jgi:superfamily II DNA helicase RecQ